MKYLTCVFGDNQKLQQNFLFLRTTQIKFTLYAQHMSKE